MVPYHILHFSPSLYYMHVRKSYLYWLPPAFLMEASDETTAVKLLSW